MGTQRIVFGQVARDQLGHFGGDTTIDVDGDQFVELFARHGFQLVSLFGEHRTLCVTLGAH